MDHSRDHGLGSALLEPEDEPEDEPETAVAATDAGGTDAPVGGPQERGASVDAPVLEVLAAPTPVTRRGGLWRTPGTWARAVGHGAAMAARSALARARRMPARVGRVAPVLASHAATRAWSWVRAHATPGRLIGLAACALSIGFYAWYAGRGLTLAYGDAISHLLIARRVLMSHTPGLAQFGTVWPPLMHILMLPFVWNETLYRSGLAGALPSMAAYVISAVGMYRLGALAFDSRAAGVVAALTLMLNPDVLYMQTAPMTEMGLICALVLTVYFSLRWVREQRPLDLVKCALAVAAGTLIRYDAWALAVALVALLGYIAWRARGQAYAKASMVVFAALGFAGCAAWVVYNQVIFGDALAFFRGPYSSEAMQEIIAAGAPIPTKGHIGQAFLVYGTASLDSIGWVVAGLALVGMVLWGVRQRRQRATASALVLSASWVPFAFNWVSLFKGTSTLDTPEFPVAGMHTYFNERYGMMMILAAALFVGYLAGTLGDARTWRALERLGQWLAARVGRTLSRRVALVVRGSDTQAGARRIGVALGLVAVVTLASGGITFGGTPYALQDPLHGANAIGMSRAMQETDWLTAHVHGQQILISYGSLAPVVYLTGFPDSTFITDADGSYFHNALAHPEQAVGWIVMDANSAEYDPVWAALHDRVDWRKYFILRAVIGSTQIYQRIGGT